MGHMDRKVCGFVAQKSAALQCYHVFHVNTVWQYLLFQSKSTTLENVREFVQQPSNVYICVHCTTIPCAVKSCLVIDR